jgi:hypothetical protein
VSFPRAPFADGFHNAEDVSIFKNIEGWVVEPKITSQLRLIQAIKTEMKIAENLSEFK